MIPYALVGLLVWILLGCVVLAIVDVHGELLAWQMKSPRKWMGDFVILFWPIVVCVYVTGGGE